MLSTLMLISTLLFGQVSAQTVAPASNPAGQTGNCWSGKYLFKKERTYISNTFINSPPIPADIDYTLYDFVVDYGAQMGTWDAQGGVTLNISPPANGQPATGIRISTTRQVWIVQYMKHAKLSAKFSASGISGLVTTFVTMSEGGDEIDWEILGKDVNKGQTNVFYHGIREYNVHSSIADIPGGGLVSDPHVYMIDWSSKALTWGIDGKEVRTLDHEKSFEITDLVPAPGQYYYPTQPSIVQISLWDGGDASSDTAGWAGGPTKWGSGLASAKFEYLEVQCYNDNDEPVPNWPDTPDNKPPSNGTIVSSSITSVSSTSSTSVSASSTVVASAPVGTVQQKAADAGSGPGTTSANPTSKANGQAAADSFKNSAERADSFNKAVFGIVALTMSALLFSL
ncbi:hypothetical protein HDU76_003375 [Blyttiomyces sp. JEL0837]|nr:hypothetical protein HDU76_003375 [Blyttiomyces sp. JEL0837]